MLAKEGNRHRPGGGGLRAVREAIGADLDEAARVALDSPYPQPEETLRNVYFEPE